MSRRFTRRPGDTAQICARLEPRPRGFVDPAAGVKLYPEREHLPALGQAKALAWPARAAWFDEGTRACRH
jgi:hypothetical protein